MGSRHQEQEEKQGDAKAKFLHPLHGCCSEENREQLANPDHELPLTLSTAALKGPLFLKGI